MSLRGDIIKILMAAEVHPWPPYSVTANRILDLIQQEHLLVPKDKMVKLFGLLSLIVEDTDD